MEDNKEILNNVENKEPNISNNGENKNNKKIKIMTIIVIILSIILVSLVGYIVYDKFIKNDEPRVSQNDNAKEDQKDNDKHTDNDNNSTTNNNPNTKYEVIQESEIKDFLSKNQALYYLNRQENNIFDIEKFLDENGKEILEDIVLTLFDWENPQKFITESEILKKAKELYGYDLEFSYIDLGEGDEVAFKWDDKAKRYMVVEPELYAHGNMYMDIEWRIKDIKRYDDNTYDVTTRQLWTDELSEGDPIENLYLYYGNAKSATDPVFSISSEESYKLKFDEIFEKAFKSIETKKDGGFYTYRIIKEKGVIKIIQYVID